MFQSSYVVGFGMFGLVVAAERIESGELVVEMESPREQAVFCVGCEIRVRSKGRRLVVLHDMETVGRLGDVEESVASLASRLDVGWQTLWTAIAQQAVAEHGRVTAGAQVGFDETVISSTNTHTALPVRVRSGWTLTPVKSWTCSMAAMGVDMGKWAYQQPDTRMTAIKVICLNPVSRICAKVL